MTIKIIFVVMAGRLIDISSNDKKTTAYFMRIQFSVAILTHLIFDHSKVKIGLSNVQRIATGDLAFKSTSHIKFDQDWPAGFRDIQIQKCEILSFKGK